MDISNFVEISDLPTYKDYDLAESGDGFVVPGSYPLASISPREPIEYVALLQ